MFCKTFIATLIAAAAAGATARAQVSDAPVEVAITERDCRALVAHRPAADAAYQPGRDVRGRAVAPADLSGNPATPGLESISIPLQIRLSDVVAVPAGIDADIPLWTLTVDADGRAYLDDQPLHDEAAVRVAEACRARFGL